ncbi:MAG: protein kinase [Candidatus Aminicenantes bacterium]|nr:MAG: protein kinase [Candidatus Aminicenantes bacterium]
MATKCPECNADNPDTKQFCGDCGTQLTPEGEPQPSFTKTLETPIEGLTRGTIFAGRYEVIEELGTGGMGKVYRVHDKKIEEEIAIKFLRPDISSDKKTIERFKNEIRIARKIGHRNVCRMYDLNEENGTSYITMEYVPGEDLKSFIRRAKRLDAGTAISIAMQMCEGLTEAHRLGVVHRDLKSSNIMIDKAGNARIMDFGIARTVQAKGLTGEGVIIGTPEYMSPEQAEAREVDHLSDIYSLGVILYEMVTGQLPFEGKTPLSIAMKHKGEKPQDPQDLNPQIQDVLNRLILRCLEKDKKARYESADKLMSDLIGIEKAIPTMQQDFTKKKIQTSKEITVTFSAKKILIPVLAAVALVIAAVIFLQLLPKKETVPIPSDKPSLAVVYFENLSRDESLDGWSTGLSNLLITDLMQSKFIDVLSGDRVFSILKKLDLLEVKKYSTEDLVKVADEGRINHTINGSFIKAGDNIIITLLLQKPHTGEVLRSMRVECSGEEEITPKVDELTKQIKLDLNITDEQIISDIDKEVGKITTSSTEAYKYYNEGIAHFQKQEFRQCIARMEKALEIDPEFAMAYLMIAKNYGWLYLVKERDKYLRKAFELSNRLSDRERYLIQGDFYRYSGKTLEAIDAYKKLIELYPDESTGNLRLGYLYEIIEEWDLAKEHYERLIPNKSDSINLYLGLSSVYKVKGLYDKSREPLEYYLLNIKDRDVVHYELAINYACQGKLDLALIEADKALSMTPDQFRYSMLKGDVFHFKGDLSRAEEEYRKLLEIEEPASHAFSYGKLATLYVLQGRFEDARLSTIKVVEIGNKIKEIGWSAGWIGYLGYFYMKSGNPEEAVKKFVEGESLSVEAGNSMWQRNNLYFKGLAYLEMDTIDKAQDVAKELKELIQKGQNRKLIRVYDHLAGKIELEKENYPQAIEYFKKALDLLPFQHQSISGIDNEHALFHDSLALAYYKIGELDKAKEEFEKITRLTTGRAYWGDIYAKSFYMLGKIFEEKGWKGKAIENYEKFLELWKDADPGFAEVEDARKRLAGLKNQ